MRALNSTNLDANSKVVKQYFDCVLHPGRTTNRSQAFGESSSKAVQD